jgi:hypothetical protein
MDNKRKIADVKKEIKILTELYIKNYGRDPRKERNKFLPGLYSTQEIEALTHLGWLNGYLRGIQDERSR